MVNKNSNNRYKKTVDSKYLYDYHPWDAREIKEKIQKKIIDVIITSPPYANLKNYGGDKQIGYGQTYHKYLTDLENIFNYCSEIVKDTGSLWIIIDTFKKNGRVELLPFDLSYRLKKEWKLQDIIIWNKDKTLPWSSKGRLRNIFEYILFFTKNKSNNYKYYIDRIKIPTELKKWWVKYPERYNPQGKTPTRIWEFLYPDSDVWKISIPTQGAWGKGLFKHSCPFPPRLVETILQLTTDKGDVVFDPFAGSGSVLAQARVMKRKAIGCDINKKFITMYHDKVYPEIKKLWKDRKKELKDIEKSQKILNEKIWKLRQLKYPKEMIKRSLKEGFSEDIILGLNSIFVIENSNEKIESDIYLIFQDTPPTNDLMNAMWKTLDKPPLSTYGYKPKIVVIDKKTFIKNKNKLKIPNTLNLYIKGRTHFLEKQISFDDWIHESKQYDWKKTFKECVPPIISDIKVKERVRELKQDTLF